MERILKRIAERMGEENLQFIMQAAAVFYWRMVYGDWRKYE